MADTNLTTFDQNYTLFESGSIKQFIIEQLNDSGITIDQRYLGSNLNMFIDIIAVMLQQLQFHYSMTASESTFATATLYENMNKLVSLFNYKPNGKQTSILPVSISSSLGLNTGKIGNYIIPRYSFINYNGPFVLREDLSFTSLNEITTLNNILYQGTVHESPVFTISGEDFQIITLVDSSISLTSGQFVTDNFFDVYVKEPNSDKWTQYKEVNSLFEFSGSDKVFERRINENYNYEFKFGNGVNGYKPIAGSSVIIFYLLSDGSSSQVGANTIIDNQLYRYNSSNFENIILNQETSIFNTTPNFLSTDDIRSITVSNSGASTPVTSVETVDIIRNNMPKIFAAQNRLLTEQDYITYINKFFNNFIKDCYVFNNAKYTGSYLKYYYDIGLNAPNDDSRICLNQINFQTSCGFNNVYVVLLPLINTIISNRIPNYVNTNLKQYIVDQLIPYKDLAHNIAPIDPIYKAVSFGIIRDDNNTLPEFFDDVKLVLTRDKYSNFNSDYIISEAINIFNSYFESVKLGDVIDIGMLSSALSQILGVKKIQMSDGVTTNDKLTFIVWNPLYEENDFNVTQQNVILMPFMYQYFWDLNAIKSRITVVNE